MSATSIDLGTVLRRHDRTMSVVDLVEDEPARWTLLEYVLAGGPGGRRGDGPCSPPVSSSMRATACRRQAAAGWRRGNRSRPGQRADPRTAGTASEQAEATWRAVVAQVALWAGQPDVVAACVSRLAEPAASWGVRQVSGIDAGMSVT